MYLMDKRSRYTLLAALIAVALIWTCGRSDADGVHPGACDLTSDPTAHEHDRALDIGPWSCLAPLLSDVTPVPLSTPVPVPTATPTPEPEIPAPQGFDTAIAFVCVWVDAFHSLAPDCADRYGFHQN